VSSVVRSLLEYLLRGRLNVPTDRRNEGIRLSLLCIDTGSIVYIVDALSSCNCSAERELRDVRLDDGRRLCDIGLNRSYRTALRKWLDIVDS